MLMLLRKKAMVEALSHHGFEEPLKHITVDHSRIHDKQLHNFMTRNTRNFFHILRIPDSFTAADPNTWSTDDSYLEAKSVVKELCVMNDTTERAVALMNDTTERAVALMHSRQRTVCDE